MGRARAAPPPPPPPTNLLSKKKKKPKDVRVINELVHKQSAFVEKLTAEVGKVIVGQKAMIERILIGLLTGGHVLLEGVPGLAKTLTVKTLADALR